MLELARERCSAWGLTLERVLVSDYSLVAAVRRSDGSPAILKLNVPEPENEHEGEGLRRWDGNGAVRVLDEDRAPERNALLLERVLPGTQLWELPEDEGVAIASRLLPRLWLRVEEEHPFERVHELAARWADEVLRLHDAVGEPVDRALVEDVVGVFRELARSPRDPVLVHRDFHRGNVLASDRDAWLAIDPKSSVGEREFDAAWLLGDRVTSARRALDVLAAELDLDRERLHAWGVARYVLGALWNLENGYDGARLIAAAEAIAAVKPTR